MYPKLLSFFTFRIRSNKGHTRHLAVHNVPESVRIDCGFSGLPRMNISSI